MLPRSAKLTSPTQFRRVIKSGTRAGSRTMVVHYFDSQELLKQQAVGSVGEHSQQVEVAATGPRFGLIVSKACGNAVVRHRTSRRLRQVCRGLSQELGKDLPITADVVIRALPAAGTASSEQLEKDLRRAVRAAAAKAPRTAGED